MTKENYDPNEPVCDNQQNFNIAFRKAIDYDIKQNMKSDWYTVAIILYFIFTVWALILAIKNAPRGPDRTLHLVFAMVASPAYVLSYYLNSLSNQNSEEL